MSGSGANGSFVYDGNLRRVKQTQGGKTIYSVYSQDGTLLYRDNITQGKQTGYLPNGIRLENGVPFYTHADHLGSPVAGTSASGAISWRESYAPFGQKLIDPAANRDNTGFTGHIDDNASGLTYMQARYYDPLIGRFLSNDPVGFAEGGPTYFNRYAYVANDPINATDPTGKSAVTKFVKQTIKHKGNVFEAAIDVGSEVVTVFAPSSTPLDRIIAAAELVSPVSVSDIKDAKKGIEAADKALGGRKGGAATGAQNKVIGNRIEGNGGKVTGGLERGPETHFANPSGGAKGGRFSDGSARDANGNGVQVQTVDTKANGSVTNRETAAARDIAERSGDPVACVSKSNC